MIDEVSAGVFWAAAQPHRLYGRILCRDRAEAEEALFLVEKWVGQNSLRLNLDKTHVGYASNPERGLAKCLFR